MYYLIAILSIILFFVYLSFIKPIIISLVFDTDRIDLHMNLRWLFPLFEVKVVMANYSPLITIYIFKMNIFRKSMRKHQINKDLNLQNFSLPKLPQYINYLKLKNSFVEANYSLFDPFATSMANVVLYFLQSFTNTINVTQNPNFMADHSYVAIRAGTNLNIGKTVTQLIRRKFQENKI